MATASRMAPSQPDRPSRFVAVASKTSKRVNQDCAALYVSEHASAVAVADGVGTSLDADLAARTVAESFVEGIRASAEAAGTVTNDQILGIWNGLTCTLKALHDKRYGSIINGSALRTTLVTLVDQGPRYRLAFKGNGTVAWIPGDFWRRLGAPIPDLLTGHSTRDPRSGGDVLYDFLDPVAPSHPPALFEYSKDWFRGEIVVLCSDGVASSEQLRTGRDPEDRLWVEVNPHLRRFISTHLPAFFATLPTTEDGQSELARVLNRFIDEESFDDDASMAVVVSEQAVRFYRQERGLDPQ